MDGVKTIVTAKWGTKCV